MVEVSNTQSDNKKDPSKISTFSSLSIPNFRWLLAGTTLTNAAQWIQQITLSWLIYDLTGSGTMLGSLNALRSLASLAMIPVAGLLIDRFNRKSIMFVSNGWLFTITLGFGLILVIDRAYILHLFIFSFLGGLVHTLSMSLRQVVVFDLVPRLQAPNALALIQTGWSLMRSFGPGIGGFLILWLGPGGNFLIQAGAYALIVITITQLKFPLRKLDTVKASAIQNIKEGIKYVAKEKTTRTFMLMGFILPLFIIPIFNISTAIYAKEVFHGGADVLGMLLASVGVGGIAGGVVTASLGKVERRGLVQTASLFLLCISLICFALTTTLWIAMSLLAAAGFFEIIFLTTNQTLLQLSIPDNLRGRVTSVVNLNGALHPLGGLIAGVGSDLFGGPSIITIIMCSIAAAIAVSAFLFNSTIRDYRLSQAIEDN